MSLAGTSRNRRALLVCAFAIMLTVAYAESTIQREKFDSDRDPDVPKEAIPETTENVQPVLTPRTTYSCSSGWRCGVQKRRR